MPYGTDVTALVATFTTTGSSVKVGSTVQVSGTTANNFSQSHHLHGDGGRRLHANYTVTVTVAPSSAKASRPFHSPALRRRARLMKVRRPSRVTVPYGTNVTALVATFTTTGSSVKVGSTVQVSGTTANNFTSPVIYTVTAADGSTMSYTVTVAVAPRSWHTVGTAGFSAAG